MKKHYNFKALTQGVKSFAVMLLVAIMALGNVFADEVTYVFSEAGFANAQDLGNGTINNVITYTTSAGEASNTPKYYTSGTAARFYAYNNNGNSMTLIPATGTIITGVDITALNSYAPVIKYSVDGGGAVSMEAASNVYTISNLSATEGVQFINAGTTQLRVSQITIHYTQSLTPIVATPTFSVGEGFCYEAFDLSLSATNGAIYYTTDGSAPTTSSTLYTTPLHIAATTTVKAIAVVNGEASNVATATYSFPVEVANIAAFKADAQSNVVYKITGDVTYVFRNGRYMFVQDATGGLLIYDYATPNITTTYNEGDVISGGIYGKVSVYNGLTEMVPTRNTAASTTNNGTIAPVEVTAANLVANYSNYEAMLVKVVGATFTSNTAFTQNGTDMAIYNRFNTVTSVRENGDVADVIGFLCAYNATKQLYPRDNYDIIPVVARLPYADNFENGNAWTLSNGTATNKWMVGQAQGFDNGKLFISCTDGATNKYANTAANVTASRDLIIPAAGAILTFDCRVKGEANHDYLLVEIANNTMVETLAQISGDDAWKTVSLDIAPAFAGDATLTFKWVNDANGTVNQYPAAIDNVSIIASPCAQVTDLAATVTNTSAAITWTPGAGQTAWTFEYKLQDNPAWYSMDVTTPSVNLTGLQGNSNYDMRVRANCGSNQGVWVNGTFTVDCQTLSLLPVDKVIGEGTSNSYYTPFNNYYRNSWNQCIYPASEVGAAGNIYSIAWDCAATGSMTLDNVKIYLGTTSHNTVESTTDWVPMSDLTLVYEGNNVAIGASTGWETYNFNTPFHYNGTDNLVVVVSKTASAYSSAIKYNYTSTSNSMMYRQNDSDVSYAQHPGTNTGTRSTYLANIKLHKDEITCGDQILCPAPTDLVVSNVTTTTADLAWTAGAGENTWKVEYQAAGQTDWSSITTTVESATLTNLTPNVDYSVRVKAVCGENNHSNFATNTFTTVANCIVPSNINNINTFNNTLVYWTPNNNEQGWIFEFKKASDNNWTSLNITNEPQAMLSNLVGSTLYEVRVKAVCDANNESDWATYQFTTDCSVTPLPYEENFNSYATTATSSTAPTGYPNITMPDCWSILNLSESTSTYPQAFLTSHSTYAVDGNCLFFKSSSTTPVYAVLPEFAENNVKVTFTYRNEGVSAYNGTLSIGTMTNIEDPSTFVEVEEFAQTTTKTERTVDVSNLNGKHIVFKYAGGSSNNYYAAIDDITVIAVTNCLAPTHVTAANQTTTSAELTWTPSNEETAWQFEYGPTGFAHGTGTVVDVNTYNYTLTGLTANTVYDVYVRAKCSAAELSDWSVVYSFRTVACEETEKCFFTLNLTDSYGDGWNGASIDVLIDGVLYDTYTVDDEFATYSIGICDNQALSLSWHSGSYDTECSYELVKGTEVAYTGDGTQTGIFFTQNGCTVNGGVTPPPTGCEKVLPYTENFESYTASSSISSFSTTPDCWDILYSGTSAGYKPHVYSGSSYNPTGTKCLIFTSGSSTYGSNAYAVLPYFTTDLNNVQMSFKYRMESTSNGHLYVGYVTDPTDGSTFVQLAAPTSKTTGTEYEMSFAGNNIPAGARIAFLWSHTSSYYSCGIDEIFVEQIPTCPRPTISGVVATQTTADVTVASSNNATSYEIVYGTPGFDPETATPIAVGANNTVTITGLTHSTNYEVYARAICSADDQSIWSNAYAFQTECGAFDVPYTQDFDGVTTTTTLSTTVMPTCWTTDFTGTSTSYGASNYESSTYSRSGTNSLKLYNYKTTSTVATYGDLYAILPELTVDLNVTAMTFYARLYSTSAIYTGFFDVGVIAADGTFTPVQTNLLPASTSYEQMTVSFANYEGPAGRIAFRSTKDLATSNATGTYAYTYLYIDDINVEQVVFNKDIELVSVEPIADACDFSNAKVTITVNNHNTSGAINSFTASYTVNNGATVTETVTPATPIAVGETYTYTFTQAPALTETVNNIVVSVSYPGDGNENNNTLTLGPINQIEPVALPFSEDFADVTIGVGGWSQNVSNNNPNHWTVVSGTPTYVASDEFNSAAILSSPCLQFPVGQYLISYDYNALGAMPEDMNVYIGNPDYPATWVMIGQHNNFTHTNVATTAEHLFNNTTAGVYYIIVEAASQRGNLGVTFDNLNIAPAYTVTITSDDNGTTVPAGIVKVAEGSDLTINAIPNAGYHLATITVNGQTVATADALQGNVYVYTLDNVVADANVNVTFTENQQKVVKTVNPLMAHGVFTPATTDLVNYGAAHTITMVAEPHYHLHQLLISNVSSEAGVDHVAEAVVNGATSTYTFDHVYSDKYVTASFRIDTCGIHYTVTGQGTVDNYVVDANSAQPTMFDHYVDYGTTFLANFVAAPGYHVANVIINGVDYGTIDAWQFAHVTGEQYVTVNFEKNTYTITTNGYGQGTVSNGATFVYDPDNTYVFTATPATGYHIESIMRNDVPVVVADPEATYTETLTNILSDYNYVVVFNPSYYTVTATSGNHGAVTPAGVTTYRYSDQALYEIVADQGYYISSITIDTTVVDFAQLGAPTTLTHTFTFTGTTATNHIISATFAQYQYTITVEAGANGTITPGTNTYAYGATPVFDITPAAGYGIVDVTVDGVSVGAVEHYMFPALTGNHTIAATFAQHQYTIAATANNGGTITPAGVTNMVSGGNQVYTITPATGYHVNDVFVDGASVGAVTTYTFSNVTANHTIHAIFDENTYTVTVNQPANGVITPGTMTVTYGATPTFVVTPNTGYSVTAITVNGSNVLANATNTNGVYTYTMNPVSANATVTATMTQKVFTITKTAGSNGSINGPATVNYGADAAYTIVPAAGYVVNDVVVDGMSMGAVTSYIFTNVVANHTIAATFRLMDCDIPTNMHTVDITTSTATFMWYHPIATSFEVQYKAVDATTFTTATVNASSYDALNLTPGTSYVWMVRANCGTGNYSEWSNGNIFRTLDEIDIHDGIEDHNVAELVKVYASHNNVYIQNNGGVQIDNVQIYDVYGKLVYSGNVTSNTEVISMNVATGTYMVRLTTDKGNANYKLYLTK